MRWMKKTVTALAVATGTLLSLTFQASAQTCELTRPVVFADFEWDSAVFHNHVARFILEKGYGCKTDAIPGSSVPLVNGMVRGDIDVAMEIWGNIEPKAWLDGLKAGKLVEIGKNFEDGLQGWFVPRYLVEGKNAPAKGLKSVADLSKFKALFKDPEERGKGRFYNCNPGLQCEILSSKKFHAYGLDADYINFRPGSVAALNSAIESALRRKRPILFYYWGPSWIYGKYQNDIVALEEPPYDKVIWQDLENTERPENVKQATASPEVVISIGANAAFAAKAPEITKFLANYHTSNQLVSEALVDMQANGGSAEKSARNFLKTHEEVWRPWVSDDVATRVKAAL